MNDQSFIPFSLSVFCRSIGNRMTRLRLIVLAVLFFLPFLVLFGIGAVHLSKEYAWGWWPFLACVGIAYFLAWRWTQKQGLLPTTDTPPPEYWTERDRVAWGIVDAKAKS